MNSKIFFVILLVIAGVVIFGISAKQEQEISATASTTIEAGSHSQNSGLLTQTKTMGAVEVEVKPVSVVFGKEVVFEVSMNTHSVELSYDYTKIATLTDELGNSYKPTKWTGGNSGHHFTGELVFEPLLENPKELTLILEGVDNKSETFSWQL
ncbi:hypothetical protein CO180_03010 [candidate division WWE3 bacterium CG_4_9_14_3_um_filter_41_6]|uniref:DUF4352 domain-containing protein n=1 Tax=candidate division WWE3 bacterium CG_4_10_14_0_2_um_filter_41_14 TaxID=1975072 RepID=A0A2M7TLK5_UNCKA|nr:MAG: hypothetical protein COY32_00835 [candidate division WWE3 bacterium CG_4_10_14_0_2_um_filter_41_14]PJA38676.1 MAG: hypothetical protein CO180_03010 [candidate division WWE3 bacterium CG_4_9_14_3_um_filter_41_6]